jgi:hypothetical protein
MGAKPAIIPIFSTVVTGPMQGGARRDGRRVALM